MTRSIRFQPDPLDHALIDFRNEESPFMPGAVGLIMNESYTGCALVVKTTEKILPNQNLRVQVGRIGILSARVIWVKPLEESLVKMGLQFLE